jgi:hypothetical protein
MTRLHRRKAPLFHPSIEFLECRWVPATITPMTFADGGSGSGSLRDAVLQFNADTGAADDTIQLQAGTYALTIQNAGGRHETAGLTGDLNLTQADHRWVIQGAGSSGTNATVIDASQLLDRVFDIVTPGTQVVFRDLVIQGGLAQDDGSDGALAGSTDARGGGILNNGGAVTLDNVVVQNNVVRGGDAALRATPGHNAQGGGFYSSGGSLTISSSTIADNQTIGGRGGDNVGQTLPGGDGGLGEGGGLYAMGSSLDISDSMIASNRATGGRGGDNPSSFSAAPLGAGGSGVGGGLYVNGGLLTMANCTVASNQGTGGAGGAYGFPGNSVGGGFCNENGRLTVTGSTLSDNSASAFTGEGGGIWNVGTLTVSNCTLAGNSAGYAGGGIYNFGALTVSNSTLSGNSARYGGGIYNSLALTVNNSTLAGNTASGYLPAGGGGIYNDYVLTVNNSTLSGNSAAWGGGILNELTATATLNNSTVSGNHAGFGGGIANVTEQNNNTTVLLLSSTIAGNSGSQLYCERYVPMLGTGHATIQLRNTIVSGPGPGPNLLAATGGTFISQGHNLSSDSGSGFLTGPGDLINTNPMLGPLQDNGGPTQTMALLPGSPAIDAGDNTGAPATDQRGFARIVGGTIDIGAFEVQPAGQTTHLSIQAPASISAGTPFTITVTALDDFGQRVTGYTGTVHFTLTGPVTAMADYTFTAGDMGQHTFSNLVLRRAGAYTVAGADSDNPPITGNTAFTITPAAAHQFVFNVPSTITAGAPFAITVTVQDAYGNTVTGYTGTVHFTLTGQAMAQANYTFTAADMGSHTFNVVLSQPGDYTLIGMDTADPTISGSTFFTVSA